MSGANDFNTLANSLKASKEYKGQQSAITSNPDVTASQLKALPSAYVSPFDIPGGVYQDYVNTGIVSEHMANEMAARHSGDPASMNAAGIYGGATASGYTNTLADFVNSKGGAGVGHKDSEYDRTLENIYQQNKLDELIRYVQRLSLIHI